MHRETFVTGDGSHSISVPELNATYHSVHGAIQESQHIFIDAGLKQVLPSRTHISIFEMGFGTGLNALLTLMATRNLPVEVYYETIEQYPLDLPVAETLNFSQQLGEPDLRPLFMQLHACRWNEPIRLAEHFLFRKMHDSLQQVRLEKQFDLVYFDAFAPSAQPELWTEEIFSKLFEAMVPGGLLLTYCSKSVVRKALAAAGFRVGKLPGPKGKREIVRAVKP